MLEEWCSDSRIIDTHCSLDREAMYVQCQPFYLPWGLTVANVTAAPPPPLLPAPSPADANISMTFSHLHIINKQQRAHLDGVHIIAEDFNKVKVCSP